MCHWVILFLLISVCQCVGALFPWNRSAPWHDFHSRLVHARSPDNGWWHPFNNICWSFCYISLYHHSITIILLLCCSIKISWADQLISEGVWGSSKASCAWSSFSLTCQLSARETCGSCGSCGAGPRRDWPKWRDHLPCTADFGCSKPASDCKRLQATASDCKRLQCTKAQTNLFAEMHWRNWGIKGINQDL